MTSIRFHLSESVIFTWVNKWITGIFFSKIFCEINSNIHIYIHNWQLHPFSQDYGLASYTTHVVCVNVIREWRDLQLNVDTERQIFHGKFIYSPSFLPGNCWEEIAEKIFFVLILRFDAWPGIGSQALRLTSRHTTY